MSVAWFKQAKGWVRVQPTVFSIDFFGFVSCLEGGRNSAQQAGRRGENASVPIFCCDVSLSTFPPRFTAGSTRQPREPAQPKEVRSQGLNFSSVSSFQQRNSASGGAFTANWERSTEQKQLGVLLGEIMSASETLTPNLPSPGRGFCNLHPRLGFTPSFWRRVCHPGGVTSRAATWLWHVNPPGTQVLALEQAAQGGGGVSFSGDVQDPPGQGPLRRAVGDPALAGGLDWVAHRGPFQPWPFCDSVILWSVKEQCTCQA